MLNILSKILLLLSIWEVFSISVLGSQEELPPSVISSAPPTPKQLRQRQELVEYWQEAKDKPLVRAAREGDFQTVRHICEHTPKGQIPDYNSWAFREAVYARHDNIATYLAYQQPACRLLIDPICYYLFWHAIQFGDRYLFDFFMSRNINVHYISKRVFRLDNDTEVYFDNVHVNAMSSFRVGYYTIGETEELKYMKDVLASRGVVNTPPLYYSGGGGCCAVQ
ncbi:MAG: hypothetical protein LBJ71_04275 [Holosporaceae bacterium]|jgi:hypothetical protein|nr:hypothetical protein [Holosporaceae bacterium]